MEYLYYITTLDYVLVGLFAVLVCWHLAEART